MVINGGKKRTPEIIFNKFFGQLKPKENFRINRLKLMTYKQKTEESLDDFVNRCRRMTALLSKVLVNPRHNSYFIIDLVVSFFPHLISPRHILNGYLQHNIVRQAFNTMLQ